MVLYKYIYIYIISSRIKKIRNAKAEVFCYNLKVIFTNLGKQKKRKKIEGFTFKSPLYKIIKIVKHFENNSNICFNKNKNKKLLKFQNTFEIT